MTPTEQKIFELSLPVVEYGLQLLLPEVPAPVWVALFGAIKAGDVISSTDIKKTLADAGITVSYQPTDFPSVPPGDNPYNATEN